MGIAFLGCDNLNINTIREKAIFIVLVRLLLEQRLQCHEQLIRLITIKLDQLLNRIITYGEKLAEPAHFFLPR